MKSYSVKSNAKRAARRMVALHTFVSLEAIEPVLDIDDQVTDGGAWFPAVRIPADTPDDLKSRLFDAVNGEAVIHGLASGADPINEANEDAVIAAEGIRPEDGVDVSQMVGTGAVTIMKGRDAGKTTSGLYDSEEVEAEEPLTPAEAGAVVAALAALPPRVERTPEEIAEARKARRARIEAGEYKAKAPAASKPVKVSKSALVYDAIKAEGGASFTDLIALTDWQKHTLRGYIAGTLRKRAKAEGLEIEAFKVKGEPTRYRALPA